jgi:predicted porin
VTAAYQQFYSDGNPGSAATAGNVGTANTSSVFTAGYNAAVSTPGVNARDSQQYYAATYDFGILKAYAQYVSRKIVFTNNADIFVQRTAQQLGVRAPITKTVTTWASAGMGKINPTGSGGNTANFTGWQIGSDYNLSKRTNLYAIYGQSSTSSVLGGLYSANGSANNNAAANPVNTSNTTGYSSSSYAVGVRHTF